MPVALTIALAAAVGLALGSVLNVVIYRLPRRLRLFRRLRCTRCGHSLAWEATPLLGFLLQLGRCRHCRQPIPIFFPLAEAFTAIVFALLVWRHGVTLLSGFYAVYSLALILTLFVDWLHHDIYYLVLVPATALALLAPLLHPDPRRGIVNALAGLGIGLLFFGLLFLFGQLLFHSQALGLGDVWLAGTIGAMTGLYGALLSLTAGIILAALGAGALLLIRRVSAKHYMPYGAFLCLAALGYLCLWAP